jgi:alpha-amylase
MVERCNSVGVKVFVEIVANHLVSVNHQDDEGGFGSFLPWQSKHLNESFPENGLNASHFHDKQILQIWNCRLLDLVDLATEDEYVQSQISSFVDELLDFGVHGAFISSAKQIPKQDIASIFRMTKLPLSTQTLMYLNMDFRKNEKSGQSYIRY